MESLNGTQFATSSLQFRAGNHVALLTATAAFRRFDAADHSVIAYISRGECGAKKNPKGKFAIVETGWCVSACAMDGMALPVRRKDLAQHSH